MQNDTLTLPVGLTELHDGEATTIAGGGIPVWMFFAMGPIGVGVGFLILGAMVYTITHD